MILKDSREKKSRSGKDLSMRPENKDVQRFRPTQIHWLQLMGTGIAGWLEIWKEKEGLRKRYMSGTVGMVTPIFTFVFDRACFED